MLPWGLPRMESRGMEQGRGLAVSAVSRRIALFWFLKELIKQPANSFHDHLF